MKISRSVRELHEDLEPRYAELGKLVNRLLGDRKEARWHYESRLKSVESFAMKLETGRVPDPSKLEDFFACTLVVEGPHKIPDAEKLISTLFDVTARRPPRPERTHLAPHSFEFDDLRLYVRWRDDPGGRPTGVTDLRFEVQVKTFLQHAWAIATHDSLYKTTAVDWSSSRIAYQVKAMLENAEVTIGAATALGASFALSRSDDSSLATREAINAVESRWASGQLPRDRRTLAQNILTLGSTLRLETEKIWEALDDATAAGHGAATLNLSPFAATLAALLRKRGAALFGPLAKARQSVFVPLEIDLPQLQPEILAKIVRA